MTRIWMGVAVILVAHAASPAIQYEFIQTSRSDSDTTDFTARAFVDGDRSKVEFLSGNAYPPGTYVIASARRLLFVDPTQKSYTELNTMSVASAIGTSAIKIDNFVPTVTKLDDQILIAGIAADHYRLTMTYDITVNFKSMPVKQSVYAVIDKWTTVQFGDVGEAVAMMTSGLQTGNAQIDEMVAAETTKIRGFPLKQTIQINTTNLSRRKSGQSQLKIPVTRTRTREFTVIKVGEVPSRESAFLIPEGFRKLNFAEQAPKSQMQVLSLEPSSK